jgi:putative transcriptional regulator
MLRLKPGIDVLQMLKDKGYNTNRMRKEKLLGENAIQNLRENKVPGIIAVEKICNLLNCQPGKFLEHVPEEKNK